ncbi:MAG: aldehyde-activating protein [Sphingopyxis terrae]|nr:MAG: aldehyde-activating protein [Sphingopyxis terrae]
MTRTGRCRCGAVRYTLSAEPFAVRLCWCRDCQYWTTGNAAVNLLVPRAAVQVEGGLSGWDSVAESGNHMRRSFCPRCGTPMFSEARENTERMVIRAGTLADPALTTIEPDLDAAGEALVAMALEDDAHARDGTRIPVRLAVRGTA